MNEEKKIYVQHKSGVGEKWEVYDCCGSRESDRYTDWDVKSKCGRTVHFLPKSEYIVCEPPEKWVDVSNMYILDEKRCSIRKVDGTFVLGWHSNFRVRRTTGGLRLEELCR